MVPRLILLNLIVKKEFMEFKILKIWTNDCDQLVEITDIIGLELLY